MNEFIISFSDKEKKLLKGRDPILGAFMDRAGDISRTGTADPFAGLVRAIMGQQVSSAAHASIWGKFLKIFPNPLASQIASADDAILKSCGLSRNKATYIRDAAKRFATGEFDDIDKASDEDIIERLTSLKGVGQWTAEMTLIFVFGRPDALSFADLAIRRGMRMLYGLEKLTLEEFERRKNIYSPLGSLASLYLWELASGKYPEYADPASSSRNGNKKKPA